MSSRNPKQLPLGGFESEETCRAMGKAIWLEVMRTTSTTFSDDPILQSRAQVLAREYNVVADWIDRHPAMDLESPTPEQVTDLDSAMAEAFPHRWRVPPAEPTCD